MQKCTFFWNTLSCILPNIYQRFIRGSSQNIEAVCSSETPVYFHQTTRLHILEDGLIYVHRSVTSDVNVTPSSPAFRQQIWYNEIKLPNCRYIHRHEPKKVQNNVTPLLFSHFEEELTNISSLQCKSSRFTRWYSIPSKYSPMNFQKQIWK